MQQQISQNATLLSASQTDENLTTTENKEEQDMFDLCFSNQSFVFEPKKLGLIPEVFWKGDVITFSSLVSNFFRRKNNPKCRFHHKLYNALKLTSTYPNIVPILGVEWISEYIILVHKKEFAKLLGVRTVEGCLFHKQGNFPAYGFVSPSPQDLVPILGENMRRSFDYVNCKLYIHKDKKFHKGCTEKDIEDWKWEKIPK